MLKLVRLEQSRSTGVGVHGIEGTAVNKGSRRPATIKSPAKPRLHDVLGPGLITGASDDDPSGIATLFSGRRAVWLYAGLDAPADLSVDVRDPDDQR